MFAILISTLGGFNRANKKISHIHFNIYGSRHLILDFGLPRPLTWRFLVTGVIQLIIGADFLLQHKLLVGLDRRRLIETRNGAGVQAESLLCPTPHLNFPPIPPFSGDPFTRLLHDFPSLTSPCTSDTLVRHGFSHHIAAEGRLVFTRLQRLSPEKLVAAKAEFNKLLAMGFVRPSSSSWASPLHMVPKGNDEWRHCGDYRSLSDITTPDRYPIPHIKDIASNLAGKTIFSKTDLVRTYHQIPVTVDDITNAVIITPVGLYEFCRMSKLSSGSLTMCVATRTLFSSPCTTS